MSTPLRARRLYTANPAASVPDVARVLDLHPSTVRAWLVAFDVQMRSWSQICKNRRNRYKENVLAMYSEAIAPRRIAKELGLSEHTVTSILKNVRRSHSEARKLWARRKYESKRETALAMVNSGMTGKETASKLGLHPNTVYKWRKQSRSNAS